MWTDLFKPAGTKTCKPGVDRVDRADSLPTAPPVRAGARFGQVAERVDRVGSCLSDPTENTGLNSASSPRGDVPDAVPPRAAMLTASTSSASTQSTQSTQSTRSTQGKRCSLLTAAEKKVLLALFEPDVVLADVLARAGDHERAQELRRTINVVWRLVLVEGWEFDAAAKAAAEWVVAQPAHPDELFFADVLTFSRGAS